MNNTNSNCQTSQFSNVSFIIALHMDKQRQGHSSGFNDIVVGSELSSRVC